MIILNFINIFICNYSRFVNHYYTPTKMHTPQFLTKASDWTRPLVPTDGPLGTLPPALPSTFLPPPSPLRLIANKPEAGRASTSVGLSTQPGPPTPTFRSDFLNLRSDFYFYFISYIKSQSFPFWIKSQIFYSGDNLNYLPDNFNLSRGGKGLKGQGGLFP